MEWAENMMVEKHCTKEMAREIFKIYSINHYQQIGRFQSLTGQITMLQSGPINYK